MEPSDAHPFAHHPRLWERFTLVYPVVSRRSGGLSIGVNLNPDTACNFDCVYCCVDRPPSAAVKNKRADLGVIEDELNQMLDIVDSGTIWQHRPFDKTPPNFRGLRDIAFSGDGEPTAHPGFVRACQLLARVRQTRNLQNVRLVVITNATRLTHDNVEHGLAVLDQNGGEVWAKLDAGSQAYYKLINRSGVPLETVLMNIHACGLRRGMVIQTMLLNIDGQPMSDEEFERYVQRLRNFPGDCRIKRVQLYTLARPVPADTGHHLTPVDDGYLQARAIQLRRALPDLDVKTYPAPCGNT
ncbi:MAG: radical SAM protein [Phycisphaera sp.]|nr:radical SAM protein [Phycisphaera sp.]